MEGFRFLKFIWSLMPIICHYGLVIYALFTLTKKCKQVDESYGFYVVLGIGYLLTLNMMYLWSCRILGNRSDFIKFEDFLVIVMSIFITIIAMVEIRDSITLDYLIYERNKPATEMMFVILFSSLSSIYLLIIFYKILCC